MPDNFIKKVNKEKKRSLIVQRIGGGVERWDDDMEGENPL